MVAKNVCKEKYEEYESEVLEDKEKYGRYEKKTSAFHGMFDTKNRISRILY